MTYECTMRCTPQGGGKNSGQSGLRKDATRVSKLCTLFYLAVTSLKRTPIQIQSKARKSGAESSLREGLVAKHLFKLMVRFLYPLTRFVQTKCVWDVALCMAVSAVKLTRRQLIEIF